jgi:hypothetical protein
MLGTATGVGKGPHAPRTIAVTVAGRPAWARRWPAVLAWALWSLALLGLAAYFWLDWLLRRAGRPELALHAYEVPYVLAVVALATVGALLAGRRPRHPVGWLLLALGLSITTDALTDAYARYGLLARPGAVPAVSYVRLLGDTFILWPACIGFILLLTPTGSLPSRRWRWWAAVAAAAPLLAKATFLGSATMGFPPFYRVTNPMFVPALATPARALGIPLVIVTLLGVVVGGASLVVRFRRAVGLERQQLRWVALAAVVAGIGFPVSVAGIAADSPTVVGVGVLGAATVLCLAIGAAVLRYRLYDLDRIISRTVTYGLLTVLLGGGYAGIVLGLGQLLGRDSSLVVAAATLVVAALFRPARRRVQHAVDRRFNRRRYDAAHTIQAFSARLRQQVDLDTLTAELLAVVDQTMQPASASLWLRPAASAPQGHSGTSASGSARQPTPASRTGRAAS